MKILYLVSTLKASGPINILFSIVQYLNLDNNEVIILTLSPEPPASSRKKDFESLGVRVLSMNLSRLKGLFLLQPALENQLSEIKPDIIHSHGFRTDALLAKINKRYKVISTLHNFPYDDYRLKYGWLKGSFFAYKHLNYMKLIKNVYACSRSIANKFKENSSMKIDYIQNGVDCAKFIVNSSNKDAMRERLQIPVNKKIFISVGSLIPRKDMATVISGFNKSEATNNACLYIAGNGVEFENLKKKSSKNVILLGNVSNIKEYLQAADYFISASLAEGLPNTVLEAMACGLPSILSDIPPHREILEENQELFCLFDVQNAEQLAIGINDIVKKDYAILSLQSRGLVEKKFSAEKMSEQYYNKYLEIINNE